jgi:uncharacterized protein (TIGR02246 family)
MIAASCLRSWRSLAVSLVLMAPSVASGQGIEQPRIPLRTALDEIRGLREAYAEAFNKKEPAAVADMFAPDATVIQSDGSVLVGKDAIRKGFAAAAPNWPQMTITSDTVRVFGHTAWDIGTTRSQPSGGGEQVSHYLVVLRRGLKNWKINSLAVVPETRSANAADSAANR